MALQNACHVRRDAHPGANRIGRSGCRRAASCRWSMRSCGSWPRRGSLRRSPARRCRRRPWCMRPICGWWGSRSEETGVGSGERDRRASGSRTPVPLPRPLHSRGHFFAAAAEAMRRILINRARDKNRQKRSGGWQRVDLDAIEIALDTPAEDLLALDEALQQLAADDKLCCRSGPIEVLCRPVPGRGGRGSGNAPANGRPPLGLRPGLVIRPAPGPGIAGRCGFLENSCPAVAQRAPNGALCVEQFSPRSPMNAATSDPKAIFFAALDQPSPAERLRYLDEACGSDRQLRARVEQLLAAHDQAGQFLGGSAAIASRSGPTRRRSQQTAQPCRSARSGLRHADRALQAAAADRRRGHGRRLHGRADRAGPAHAWR